MKDPYRVMYLINGQEVSKEDFNVPIEDMIVWRGDGIFEAIRIHEGFPFGLELHLERMASSARKLNLKIDTNNIRQDILKVAEFINNGGNATQAAKTVGVSDGSASTVGYRMKNRLINDIETEQKEALKGYASKALHQIQTLAETAVSENVKLNANRDLLDRAGWKPVDKSEITEVSDLQNMTDEELQAELDGLYKARGKKLVDA